MTSDSCWREVWLCTSVCDHVRRAEDAELTEDRKITKADFIQGVG